MASERRGQGPQNGGSQRPPQGGSGEYKETVNRLQERAGELGEQARAGYESARESALHSYRQAEGAVARNPSTAVLVGFGVGVGVGLLLTGLFAREERPWYEGGDWAGQFGRLPRRASYWGNRLGDWGERVGDQVSELGRAVARNIPDSLRHS